LSANCINEFDGWLGAALLASFPSFIVTEEAERRLQETRISGARFDEVKITTSGEFRDFYPNRRLPKFVWLRVDGQPGKDDFGTTLGGKLIISERALEALKELGIPNALVTPFGS